MYFSTVLKKVEKIVPPAIGELVPVPGSVDVRLWSLGPEYWSHLVFNDLLGWSSSKGTHLLNVKQQTKTNIDKRQTRTNDKQRQTTNNDK